VLLGKYLKGDREMLRTGTFGAACLGGLVAATAADACPDWRQNGYVGRYSGDDLYDPQRFEITAGGEEQLSRCKSIYGALRSDKGEGFFTEAPDFTLETPGMNGYRLVISVVSRCDSALLINTPAGNWYYDDDDNGNLDAKIELTSPSSGILDIWVGTHDGAYCDAILQLETF
jgi:non-specific serine/threonine protein kinase